MVLFRSQKPQKSSSRTKGEVNRLLISVNVIGSSGPIRFVVNKDDLVASVIDTTLRAYSRQGRLPVLGYDLNNFQLYCANNGYDVLSNGEMIGSNGVRNFVLCKKLPQQQLEMMTKTMAEKGPPVLGRKKKSGRSWKALVNRALSLKISSH